MYERHGTLQHHFLCLFVRRMASCGDNVLVCFPGDLPDDPINLPLAAGYFFEDQGR